MKRILYLAIVVFFYASCEDIYYMDGRITTAEVKNITAQSAMFNGNIEILKNGRKTEQTVMERGFDYGTSPNELNICIIDKDGKEGTFQCEAKSLMPNTKYYVRAFATISYYDGMDNSSYSDVKQKKTFTGNIIEFKTKDEKIPVQVETLQPMKTATGVKLSGVIINEGYPAYSERGFCYSKTGTPTIENNKQIVPPAETNFSMIITSLIVDTTYYVRAFVMQNGEPIYGNEISYAPTNAPVSVPYVEIEEAGIAVAKENASSRAINWTSANNLCNAPLGGFNDWRLPTIEELGTIFTHQSIIGNFPASYYNDYWSSSNTNSNYYYSILNMSDGTVGTDYHNNDNFCRCVRTLP